jgi:leucine dehydrogenase
VAQRKEAFVSVFEQMASMGHEQVVFCRDDKVGLRAIIAVHDSTLGQALGGCRLYPYASEEEALRDCLRLSRGMTYKAAVAGLDLGGGKSVIIGDPSIKSEGLFRAFGRFVESLNGRYITAEDMNTTVEDMSHIRRETEWVTGKATYLGGSGDPSPVTAWGTFHGVRACLEVVYGSPDVAGKKVAIQGCGSVGRYLAHYLSEAGAELFYTDISKERVQNCIDKYGGTAVSAEDWYSLDVDVLAPCAVGGIINQHTIPLLKAPIIAGGANNQLDDEIRDAEALAEKGITYAPDYVINAGGLVNVCTELRGLAREQAMEQASNIFVTVKDVINLAKAQGITSIQASNKLAEARIEAVAGVKRFHL